MIADMVFAQMGQILLDPVMLFAAIFSVAIGIILGMLPGISSTMALAVMLPITFGMAPSLALLFLIGIFVSSVFGGSISAILLGIPGTPGAIMTKLDGYPMAKQGKGGFALTYALVGSTVGGLLGLIILMLIAPVLTQFAMNFRSQEYAMIALLGLVLLAYSSEGSMLKGLLVGAIGLICGMVGFDLVTDVGRFEFGSPVLQGGLDIVAVTVGIFGLAEVLRSLSSIKSGKQEMPQLGRMFPPIREFLSRWSTIIRGSAIGVLVGAVPAAGSTVAVAVSYAQEVRFSKTPEKFGKGAPEGVLSPESANSACIGGSMIPMMTFGIPGDSITAILIGALMLHGLQPGPMFFTEHPDMVGLIYAALFISVILTLLIGLVVNRSSTLLLKVQPAVLLVAIAVLCVVGTYAVRNTVSDIYIMVFFGVLGYAMHLFKLPVAPLVFGLILGPMFEENLRRSLTISRGSWMTFLERPLSLAMFLVAVAVIAVPIFKALIRRPKAQAQTARV